MKWLAGETSRFFRGQRGISLIETLVALSILGAVAVVFLSSLTGASRAAFIIDEQSTAESLARSQMEWVKNASYVEGVTQYSPAPMPSGGDYIYYTANITTESLRDPDDGLQKITVTIKHHDKTVIQLESYKRDK